MSIMEGKIMILDRDFIPGKLYEQAISFVSGFDHSSVYYLNFDDKNLKCKKI